eukprot:5934473-Alexandrium_andersonii.AAC.1
MSLARAVDRLGHARSFPATLPRGQADPSCRALKLCLNVDLLGVGHRSEATRLGAASIGHTGHLRAVGVKSRS